jgi:hypothetical protein
VEKYLISYVFFSILCSICSAIIADSKGQPKLLWCLIGLFLSYFGVILTAGLPDLKDRNRIVELETKVSDMKRQITKLSKNNDVI